VYNGFSGLEFPIGNSRTLLRPKTSMLRKTRIKSDKQFRYDGSLTRGVHIVRYGYSINRILGGGFASFFGPCSAGDPDRWNRIGQLWGHCGSRTLCPDPLNGYFVSSVRLGNGQGFFTEKPGFGLAGGGLQDWRQGAYISDNWESYARFSR